MTLVWFVIWLIADNLGDREALLFDPLNAWAWTLLLVVALDLGRQHTPDLGRARSDTPGKHD